MTDSSSAGRCGSSGDHLVGPADADPIPPEEDLERSQPKLFQLDRLGQDGDRPLLAGRSRPPRTRLRAPAGRPGSGRERRCCWAASRGGSCCAKVSSSADQQRCLVVQVFQHTAGRDVPAADLHLAVPPEGVPQPLPRGAGASGQQQSSRAGRMQPLVDLGGGPMACRPKSDWIVIGESPEKQQVAARYRAAGRLPGELPSAPLRS